MTLYDTLGVKPDASAEEIKNAYRKGAKEPHPDAGGDKEKFGALIKAYEVLSDEASRDRYDRTGAADAPTKIDAMAEDMIGQLFDHLISQMADAGGEGIYENAVDIIRKSLRQGLAKCRAECIAAKTDEARWRRQRPRFRGKVLERILDERIRLARSRFERAQREQKAGERALEILETYEHEPDPRPEPQAFRWPGGERSSADETRQSLMDIAWRMNQRGGS